ncbi:MAG: CpsD/CapB family tyrosine-protein kinase [Burkholderiales bacterium]
MSKIEKALNRAREGRGSLQVVPLADAGTGPATGTAVVADRAAHPETIPRMAKNEVRMLGPDDLTQQGIIQPQHSEDPAVLVFRELRTKIIEQSQGRNAVILVASVTKGCGSSFVAKNLAAAFAFDMGKTALLIDCNLKSPSAHKLLGNSEAPGLADYFGNPDLDIKDIVHPVGIARYRVITAGKRREILEEHFTSGKMKRLMESARERYQERFIIMDGPPMSKIADIRILSELADYVLVVARYARSTNTRIASCLDTIDEKKLLGIVFNEEPRFPRIR